MHCSAHHEVHLDFQLDVAASHQELGFAGICGCNRVRQESPCRQSLRSVPDCFVDACQRLFPWKRVVGKDQIEIDGEARHIAHKKIDGRAALECEDSIRKDYGRDLRQQPSRVEVDLVHGLSTSRPSAEWETQGRSLPVGSSSGSSFLIHGSENSPPSCRQRRTVLTFVQHFSNSRSTSARRLYALSINSLAS